MNKKTALAVLLCFVTVASPAQKKPFSGIKTIKTENIELKSKIDSLQNVIDSLILQEKDARLLALKEEESNDTVKVWPVREFTMEETDSLLALWYENNFSQTPEPDVDFDLDSLNFSSDVPDSVIVSRLAAMNAPFSIPFNETVKKYIVLCSEKMPETLSRLLGLSNYYFPIIEEALLRYHLPLELKFMTIVESRLKPTALSPAGAMGLWQFMYRTAKSYGLKMDSYVDERMEAEKSADAAARFLRDAYDILGDWSLAVSSYNCGLGNINKAIQRAGGKRDFWSIHDYLPRETRRYIPAIVGAMYAMNYAREYGIQPADVGMPAMVDTFKIRKNLHFKQISEVVGVPMEDLKNLNPSYYHEIIPGDKGECTLKLPYSWTTAFLAANQDSLYQHNANLYLSEKVLKESENYSWAGSYKSGEKIKYKVKSGDMLGKIAAHYHVSVKQLKNWNNLHSDRLSIGQTLYIYK